MNSHQPPGQRSGEGTSQLWALIREDDRRKRPSMNEAPTQPAREADHRRLRGDVLRPPQGSRN